MKQRGTKKGRKRRRKNIVKVTNKQRNKKNQRQNQGNKQTVSVRIVAPKGGAVGSQSIPIPIPIPSGNFGTRQQDSPVNIPTLVRGIITGLGESNARPFVEPRDSGLATPSPMARQDIPRVTGSLSSQSSGGVGPSDRNFASASTNRTRRPDLGSDSTNRTRRPGLSSDSSTASEMPLMQTATWFDTNASNSVGLPTPLSMADVRISAMPSRDFSDVSGSLSTPRINTRFDSSLAYTATPTSIGLQLPMPDSVVRERAMGGQVPDSVVRERAMGGQVPDSVRLNEQDAQMQGFSNMLDRSLYGTDEFSSITTDDSIKDRATIARYDAYMKKELAGALSSAGSNRSSYTSSAGPSSTSSASKMGPIAREKRQAIPPSPEPTLDEMLLANTTPIAKRLRVRKEKEPQIVEPEPIQVPKTRRKRTRKVKGVRLPDQLSIGMTGAPARGRGRRIAFEDAVSNIMDMNKPAPKRVTMNPVVKIKKQTRKPKR